MWKLLIRYGESGEADFPLLDELTIGRDADNSIWLDDEDVSRRHARVFLKDRAALVEDLGSTNGIYCNGEKIEKIRDLRPGDILMVGSNKLLVTWSGNGPAPQISGLPDKTTTTQEAELKDAVVEQVIAAKRKQMPKPANSGQKTGCFVSIAALVLIFVGLFFLWAI